MQESIFQNDGFTNQMTKEELEKEADAYAEEHAFRVPYDGSNKFYDDVDFKASKEGYFAAAEPREKRIEKLEAKIGRMKLQYDYAFNQLCKSREILCSMLSQYRDRKEIDYSTRECGEKILKEGLYKND